VCLCDFEGVSCGGCVYCILKVWLWVCHGCEYCTLKGGGIAHGRVWVLHIEGCGCVMGMGIAY